MKIYFTFLLAVICGSLFAQNRETFTKERIVRTCVRIHTIKGSSGSGFLVSDGVNCYLITAAHVADSVDAHGYLSVDGRDHYPITIDLKDLCIKSVNFKLPWKMHKTADIALLNLDVSGKYTYLNQYALPINNVNFDLVTPSRDDQLVVFGFALNFGTSPKFSPLSMRTSAASDLVKMKTARNINNESIYFLLETPSIQGYSGGPVFDMGYQVLGGGGATVTSGKGTICYGIITETLPDNTGGKLAGVVPMYYIKELLKN